MSRSSYINISLIALSLQLPMAIWNFDAEILWHSLKQAIFANCLKEKSPTTLGLGKEHLSCCDLKKKKKVKQLGQESWTKIVLSEKNLSPSHCPLGKTFFSPLMKYNRFKSKQCKFSFFFCMDLLGPKTIRTLI